MTAASSHAGSNAVRDAAASRISVTAIAGDVDFTMAGEAVAVAPNATVLLPARIVTGHDGNASLTQAGTNVTVASDTDVEIPAEAADGNLIARLVQHRGNVFYDVAPRDLGKLRVETPLLVAVIKGTQFNVAVLPDSTTISLFEGRLEIRTPDNGEVVQLDAGEIAIRSIADGTIRVVGMDDERVVAPRAARTAVAAAADETAPSDTDLASRAALANDGVVARVDMRGTIDAVKPRIDVEGGAPAPLALDTRVAVESGAVDVALDTRLAVGSTNVDVGLDAAVGSAIVDLGLDTSVDLGAGTVDAAVDAALDLGGSLDAGVDASLELGVTDASLDTAATLDVDTLDLGVDAGLDVGGALDLGLDVDVGGGTIDLGLEGSDDAAPAPAPEPPPPPNLLRGLLGLP